MLVKLPGKWAVSTHLSKSADDFSRRIDRFQTGLVLLHRLTLVLESANEPVHLLICIEIVV